MVSIFTDVSKKIAAAMLVVQSKSYKQAEYFC
jgi:hypothetical protein